MQAQKTANRSVESNANSDAKQKPTFVIKIKDFTALAEFITSSTKPAIKVPEAFVDSLKRAISLRKEHSAWSQIQTRSEADEALFKSDVTHTYFLGILERTFEILKCRMHPHLAGDAVTASDDNANAAEMKPTDQIQNRFSNLGIDEPSQVFLDAPDVEVSAGKELKPGPPYKTEPLQTLEEEYLALHCFFEDVDRVRSFLKQLWGSYLEGTNIAAVAITVNAAVDFVRGLEQDFELQFPSKKDYEDKIDLFFRAQCQVRGQEPGGKERPSDLINFKVYDLIERVMLGTYSTLSSLQDVLVPGNMPVYKPGHFGTRDTAVAWLHKSPRAQFKDDQLVLFEAWPDLVLLSIITAKSPLSEDELIRGIRGMKPGATIPLWFVFAFQCFLDAQHILGSSLKIPYLQLKQTSGLIFDSIKSVLEFHKSLRIDNWPKQNDAGFDDMLTVIKNWVQDDLIAQRFQKMAVSRNVPPPEPFRLLKQFPVLCGLWSFALKVRNQELGVAFTGAWGSIMYAGHLYNAVRQEKLISAPWKDMELLLALQGDQKFFTADRPKALDEYLKRFALCMGYSATLMAKNRRKNAPVASAKGPRGLSELGAVSQLCAGRYCNNDLKVAWTRESITPIIESKIDDSEDEDEKSPDAIQGQPRIGKSRKQKPKATSTGTLIRTSKLIGPDLSIADFLELLANSLHAETLEISFDYLLMHQFCWMLLRSVNEACRPQLLKAYGSGYLEQENQLPFVIGYIFMACTETSRIAELVLPKRKEVEISSRLLATAANAVQEMIESGCADLSTKKLEMELGAVVDFEELSADGRDKPN